MGADDYQRFVRYYNNEPFGFPREERRMAELTAAVHRASPNKWRNDKVTTARQWIYSPHSGVNVEEAIAEWSSFPGLKSKRRGD